MITGEEEQTLVEGQVEGNLSERGLRWRRAIRGGGEQSDVEGSEQKWSNGRW